VPETSVMGVEVATEHPMNKRTEESTTIRDIPNATACAEKINTYLVPGAGFRVPDTTSSALPTVRSPSLSEG
jgi:hypothetical protein